MSVSAFSGERFILENWLCGQCGSLRFLHVTWTCESTSERRNNMAHSHKHIYACEPCSDLCFLAVQLITNRVIIQHHREKTQIIFLLNTHAMCSVKFIRKREAGHERWCYMCVVHMCGVTRNQFLQWNAFSPEREVLRIILADMQHSCKNH